MLQNRNMRTHRHLAEVISVAGIHRTSSRQFGVRHSFGAGLLTSPVFERPPSVSDADELLRRPPDPVWAWSDLEAKPIRKLAGAGYDGSFSASDITMRYIKSSECRTCSAVIVSGGLTRRTFPASAPNRCTPSLPIPR